MEKSYYNKIVFGVDYLWYGMNSKEDMGNKRVKTSEDWVTKKIMTKII